MHVFTSLPIFEVQLQLLMETNALQIVLSALQQLVTCNNNGQIAAITRTLDQQMNQQGYISILVSIVQCAEIDQNIAFAALAQLKNAVRSARTNTKFNKNDSLIFPMKDLQFLLDSMISMNVIHSNNRTAFKLLKDVCSVMAEELVSISPRIHELLMAGQELKACLNILLGMANSFRMDSPDKKIAFIEVLEVVMPAVYKLVHVGEQKLTGIYWSWYNNQTPQALHLYNKERQAFEEILYMAIKLACKTATRQLPPALRELYCEWAAIAQSRLDQENEHYSQNARLDPSSCGKRGTDEFNYFHGKKWAAKFMIHLFDKILVCKRGLPEATKITLQFLKRSAESLKETIRRMFERDQPTQLRYIELSLLHTFHNSLPKVMRTMSEHFLFEVLPRLSVLTAQQISNLTDNPEQFIISETVKDSPRVFATDLWCTIALQDSQKYQTNPNKDPQEGELIVKAYEKIKQWMLDSNWEVQQIALSYMIRLNSKILFYPRVRAIAIELLEICLPNIFNQPNLVLQVRGFELITHMKKFINAGTFPILQEVALEVLRQREAEKGVRLDAVAIYAGVALEKILDFGSRDIRKLTGDQIRLVLSNVLYLMKQYEVSELNETLIAMISNYPKEMNCYSVQLVRFLCQTLRDTFERTLENPAAQLSESACETMNVLAIMTSLGSNDGDSNMTLREVIEEELTSMLEFALLCEDKLNSEYLEGLFQALDSLINAQTNKAFTLSPRLNFYFTFLIFQLVPFDAECIQICNQSNFLTSVQKILLELPIRDLLQTNLLYSLFRNYLKFIDPSTIYIYSDHAQLKANLFHCDLLNQFMYLLRFYYKQVKKNAVHNQVYNILRGRYLVICILISLLENHENSLPEQVYLNVIKIILINTKKSKFRPHLVKKNLQLFCMWIWSYPKAFQYIQAMNTVSLSNIFLKISKNNFTLTMGSLRQNQQQRRRVIVGFCKMIEISQVDAQIQNLLAMLIEWIFYMTTACIRDSKDQEDDDEEQQAHKPRENSQLEGEEDLENGENDDLFAENHIFDDEIDQDRDDESSYICKTKINELQYVLETMLRLKAWWPDFYFKKVICQHKEQLQKILNFCSLDQVGKYLQLFQI